MCVHRLSNRVIKHLLSHETICALHIFKTHKTHLIFYGFIVGVWLCCYKAASSNAHTFKWTSFFFLFFWSVIVEHNRCCCAFVVQLWNLLLSFACKGEHKAMCEIKWKRRACRRQTHTLIRSFLSYGQQRLWLPSTFPLI